MKTADLIIERSLNAPIDLVWKAISDLDHMRQWYFKLAEFKAEKGFRFQFTAGPEDGIQYVHLCEVTEVIPHQKLTYSWVYEGYEGMSYVSFELAAEGEKTKLTLTHTGLDTFPDSPDFARHNFMAGWTAFITELLPAYLQKVQDAS